MRVDVRTHITKSGWHSFYLRAYLGRGAEKRFPLNIRANPKDKFHYAEAKRYAEDEASKLRLKLSGGSSALTKRRRNDPFVEFFKTELEKRTGTTQKKWRLTLLHLERYDKAITFAAMDAEWIDGFKVHLRSKLSQNGASAYFDVFKTCLRAAAKYSLLDAAIVLSVKPIKTSEVVVDYLRYEDLHKLADTPSSHTESAAIRRIGFFFATFAALSFQELTLLKREHITRRDDGTVILRYTRPKTKFLVNKPLPEQAIEYLDEALALTAGAGKDALIFPMGELMSYNKWLKSWAKRAGVERNIHSHVARHSGAMYMLEATKSLSVTAAYLGHQDERVTRRYSRISADLLSEEVKKVPRLKMKYPSPNYRPLRLLFNQFQ